MYGLIVLFTWLKYVDMDVYKYGVCIYIYIYTYLLDYQWDCTIRYMRW